MSRDNPEAIDAPIHTHTQGNDSNIGSVSTGIVALSISSRSGGPMTESSGIDAASLSDSSSATEIPETLPSLLDRQGHDFLQTHPQPRRRGVLRHQIALGEEVVESLSNVLRMRSHEPWRMDATQITAEMTD